MGYQGLWLGRIMLEKSVLKVAKKSENFQKISRKFPDPILGHASGWPEGYSAGMVVWGIVGLAHAERKKLVMQPQSK